MIDIIEKLEGNILHVPSFIDENILEILPQSKKVVPCISRTFSIPASKTMDTDVNVIISTTSVATLTRVAAIKTQVGLLVAKKTLLKQKYIGTVKVVFKGTGFLYFEPIETVFRPEHLMPVRGTSEVRSNVRLGIFVTR